MSQQGLLQLVRQQGHALFVSLVIPDHQAGRIPDDVANPEAYQLTDP